MIREFLKMELISIKNINNHSYDGIQIFLILNGKVNFILKNEKKILRKNDIFLLNCSEIYSTYSEEENIALLLKLPYEYMKKESEELLRYNFECCSSNKDDESYQEIRRLLIASMTILNQKEDGYKISLKLKIFQLLNYLYINFKSDKSIQKNVSNLHPTVEKIVRYIEENYKNNITLNELAKSEYTSVHYLSKLFKKELGVGFLNYLTDIRLVSALHDVLFGGDTITKIAFDNGFASVNAFITAFRKKYGCTPTQYRENRHQLEKPMEQNVFQVIDVESFKDVEELFDYLREAEYGYSFNKNNKKITIEANIEKGKYPYFDKIVRVGDWKEILRSDVKEELIVLQKELNFQYVHIDGLAVESLGRKKNRSFYEHIDYIQVAKYLLENNYTPLVRVILSEEDLENVEDLYVIIKDWVLAIRKYLPYGYISKWKIEVVLPNSNLIENEQLFIGLCREVKKYIPEIKVGILVDSTVEDWEEELSCFLVNLKGLNGNLDFYTFLTDPIMQEIHSGNKRSAYSYFISLNEDLITRLQIITKNILGLSKSIYLLEWNTISGVKDVEHASFYRAALIADSVIRVSSLVEGVGVWISDRNSSNLGVQSKRVLSLFHYGLIKRVLFHVFDAVIKLGDILIYQDETAVVTRNKNGEYMILLFNPCYFNPSYAVDYKSIDLYDRKINIQIAGMRSGCYIINELNYKMNISGAINDTSSIHRILDINNVDFNDNDTMNSFYNITAPRLVQYRREVTDSLNLNTLLHFNCMTFYKITLDT